MISHDRDMISHDRHDWHHYHRLDLQRGLLRRSTVQLAVELSFDHPVAGVKSILKMCTIFGGVCVYVKYKPVLSRPS